MPSRARVELPPFHTLAPFQSQHQSMNQNYTNDAQERLPTTSYSPSSPENSRISSPNVVTTSCAHSPMSPSVASSSTSNWRDDSDMRRLRSRIVVLIERMLTRHEPHAVLTEVPENTQWQSKTIMVALKIERLIFHASTSRASYLNEQTLNGRVRLLSRHMVRLRKRKNAIASSVPQNA